MKSMENKSGTRALSSRLMNKQIASSKRSQVTIFIIIAVIIIAVITLFFLIRGESPIDMLRPSMPEPQSAIEQCTKDATSEAIAIMLPQGGYINPENYKLYNNNKIAYLCYNQNYYYPCINQEPMYIKQLKKEIHNYIEPKIRDCFYSLKQEYRERNYGVSDGLLSFEIDLKPKTVEINIQKKFEIKKGDETRKFETFKVRLLSPLYDLALVAGEIASQEAKYCYFEYLGYSLLYPSISVEKNQVGSEETASKIYTIKDKFSGKELLIAIRSCAMPGGL